VLQLDVDDDGGPLFPVWLIFCDASRFIDTEWGKGPVIEAGTEMPPPGGGDALENTGGIEMLPPGGGGIAAGGTTEAMPAGKTD
jgi:hypothetical protein